ncbi:MAG: gliding motility protein GldN [Paludibacter sp.]|nr:gliding motility protein GldN [Bacteroidales bacterium]MCM1069575.1 gliding motility protein GldN [Prevotella sp.]MCM1354221.1 gliding motility protein GldN [Bacteroides sp.]MCM1443040.1 gliding motility protein GldN [Muribaculum sp.]MCM1482295.1 gliding motility protein GldN [Paludibacter sp.]
MKKLSAIAILLLGVVALNAQHPIYPFFDDKGAVRLETVELNDASDTLVSVFHRADDIVWSRIVYRIIDMRYKQNYQLYFPVITEQGTSDRNLFRVILDAIGEGLPVYQRIEGNIKPVFAVDNILPKSQIPPTLMVYDQAIADEMAEQGDTCYSNVACSNEMLYNYNAETDQLVFNEFAYSNGAFIRNQLKYMIQEIVFFDKHTSRLYSKIIAIAPLQSDKIQTQDDVMTAINQSMLFWISFDELRPYLARQYMIPQSNDTKRMTYDEFFAKKLYTSYILGDSNMYNRMFPSYTRSEEEIKKEQQRVFDELLNFEQDLWEY